MPIIPLFPLFLKSYQFQKEDGTPADSYRLFTYVAGSSTPATFFSDSDGATPTDNPYILNADGRPEDTLYISNDHGYKIIFTTDEGPDDPTPLPTGEVVITTDDNIENGGNVGVENFGLLIVEESQLGMTDGQQIAEGTTYVTISGSVNPTTVYLPSAAATKFPIVILNVHATNDAQVVRDGTDIFLGGDQLVDLPVGASPMYTGCQLVSDGVSTWRFMSFWIGT